jgi:Kef-type K+ transport system membrane component KefB
VERVLALGAISALMFLFIKRVPVPLETAGATATLSFGFLIISAYLMADLLSRLRLPKITGYILAGMLFGPSLTGLLTREVVAELRLVDDLALTFIAFAAGGELRLELLRKSLRSVLSSLLGITLVTFSGVTLVLVLARDWFPFTAGRGIGESVAIAAICGAISVARSPSSAIAIISETRSRGTFTRIMLGVTVAMDVLAIFVFAITVSVTEAVLTPGRSLNVTFLLGILGSVGASVVAGLLLGKVVAFYLTRVRAQLTFFTLGVAFLVTQLSHGLALALEAGWGVQFTLEPMLICITAGFIVQNYSKHGVGFLKIVDRSSLPIYAIFFALSGASLHLSVLRSTWHWALGLLGLRALFIYLGCWTGHRAAGDPAAFRRVAGLAYLTQAGVSLGLVKVLISTFPTFGPAIATLLVAVITLNQVIGPVGLKFALTHVGETWETRRTARS